MVPQPVVMHAPARQLCPRPQKTPHAPQFDGSLDTSTQRAPQHAVPGGHITPPQRGALMQRPWSQLCPGAQTLPHAPQLVGFEVMSTQVSPQHAEPGAQPRGQPGMFVQTPSVQVWAGLQARPHAPQLSRSKRGLTQPVAQHMAVDEHAGPPLQVGVETQRFEAH